MGKTLPSKLFSKKKTLIKSFVTDILSMIYILLAKKFVRLAVKKKQKESVVGICWVESMSCLPLAGIIYVV